MHLLFLVIWKDAMLQMDWFVSSLLPYIGGLRNLRSFAVAKKANLFIISSLGSCLSCKAACLALFAIFPDIPIMILTVSLADVQTLSDLAAKLNVPRAALFIVNITTDPCKRASCNLPTCAWNCGYCRLWSPSWYPSQYNDVGDEKERSVRGYGLYGPQFMRKTSIIL